MKNKSWKDVCFKDHKRGTETVYYNLNLRGIGNSDYDLFEYGGETLIMVSYNLRFRLTCFGKIGNLHYGFITISKEDNKNKVLNSYVLG